MVCGGEQEKYVSRPTAVLLLRTSAWCCNETEGEEQLPYCRKDCRELSNTSQSHTSSCESGLHCGIDNFACSQSAA
eukprot:COSAG05_NODE_1334_length_5151_cov_3.207641_9_plen_76_part_00